MKIAILMENTCGNTPCECEHGLSIYVETEKNRILVDTGASEKTWKNAEMMGIDLSQIDAVFLSHGHYDHSGGILSFCEKNNKIPIYMQKTAMDAYYHGERYIGIDEQIATLPNVHKLDGEFILDEEISVFSHITGRRLWPKSNKVLSKKVDGILKQDEFEHEQCVVIRGVKTVLISGCAHNGILNVLDRYNELYGDMPDIVISGFHMMKKNEYKTEEIADIENTARELSALSTVFYSGHCTGQKAMDLMKPILGEKIVEMHSGDIYYL